MDQNVIQNNKDRLLKSIPVVNQYLDKFHSINARWAGAITAGMIETGCMAVDAARLFTPLIQDMGATKKKIRRHPGAACGCDYFRNGQKGRF